MFSLACGARSNATRAVMLSLAAFSVEALSQLPLEPSASSGPARQSLSAWLEQTEVAAARLEEIQQEESLNGPHSEALIDKLVSLGLLYLELGQQDLAVESVERAVQVHRANYGLYSLDQVPMLRQLIATEQSRGNVEAVQQLQSRILRLARLHSDDLRTVPMLIEAAERQMGLYQRYLDGESPPQINISIGFSMAGSNRPAGPFALRQARRNYEGAIRVILRAEAYDHQALHELERKLIHSYYLDLTADRRGEARGGMLHLLGREAHRRLIAYNAAGGTGTVEDFARALVELADWDLLFSRNGAALDQYREAYNMLAEHGASADLIAELFAPEAAVAIPAFLPSPLLPDDGVPSGGHVEVAFDVSKYGRSRNIEIIGMADETGALEEKDVIRVIRRTRFRPTLIDGEAQRGSSFVVRYPL